MEITTFTNFGVFLVKDKIRVFIASNKLGIEYQYISAEEGKLSGEIIRKGHNVSFILISVNVKSDTIDCIGYCKEKAVIEFED